VNLSRGLLFFLQVNLPRFILRLLKMVLVQIPIDLGSSLMELPTFLIHPHNLFAKIASAFSFRFLLFVGMEIL